MEIKIKNGILEKMIESWNGYNYPDEDEIEVNSQRNDFIALFNIDRLKNIKKEDYFPGLGKKAGNLSYELEWRTIKLGSIKGGSKYKFGYEDDFNKIKNLIIQIARFNDSEESFYQENEGNILTKEAIRVCQLSKEIKGLVTGRTVTGKLFSIYCPNTILPLWNDQDYLLDIILADYQEESNGLERFLKNNYAFLRIKNMFTDKLSDDVELSNNIFMRFLYFCFPKNGTLIPGGGKENSYEVLEYQHYQTLIHKNFKKLFGNELSYLDPDAQNIKNGQYDTEDAGTMDFLCIDKNNDFVVIELKRKATDSTIGQLCRYMGWVKQNLCKDGQKIKGIILADSKDIYINYALNIISDRIEFRKIELNIKILKK